MPLAGRCGFEVKTFFDPRSASPRHAKTATKPGNLGSSPPKSALGDPTTPPNWPCELREAAFGHPQEVPGPHDARGSGRPATGRVRVRFELRFGLRFHAIKRAGRVSSSEQNITRGDPRTTHEASRQRGFPEHPGHGTTPASRFVEESWGERGGDIAGSPAGSACPPFGRPGADTTSCVVTPQCRVAWQTLEFPGAGY